MANPELKFYFREPTIDTNLPITVNTFPYMFITAKEIDRPEKLKGKGRHQPVRRTSHYAFGWSFLNSG